MELKQYKIESVQLETAIKDVLQLQQSLIAKRDDELPRNGFLISAFMQDELRGIMHQHEGVLYCLYENDALLGYGLITKISEFQDLLKDKKQAHLELNGVHTFAHCHYLYQLGVRAGGSRRGLGSTLLNEMRKDFPSGLLTDVLFEPLNNEASIAFFKKHGFQEIGTLVLKSYRDFGQLRSMVLTWSV